MTVLLETVDNVATLTMNRPEAQCHERRYDRSTA